MRRAVSGRQIIRRLQRFQRCSVASGLIFRKTKAIVRVGVGQKADGLGVTTLQNPLQRELARIHARFQLPFKRRAAAFCQRKQQPQAEILRRGAKPFCIKAAKCRAQRLKISGKEQFEAILRQRLCIKQRHDIRRQLQPCEQQL